MGYRIFKHPTIKTGERRFIGGREHIYHPVTGWRPLKMTKEEKLLEAMRRLIK